MKKRFYIAALAIITVSTCVFGGCVLNERNENETGTTLTAFVERSSNLQDQEYFMQYVKTIALQRLYVADSNALFSSNTYLKLTAELEYEFEQLSELEEGSDEYKAKIKEINCIWGHISILAGELNSRFQTESKSDLVGGETSIMINNYFEQATGDMTSIQEETKKSSFFEDFLRFMKLNNCTFTFTYSTI